MDNTVEYTWYQIAVDVTRYCEFHNVDTVVPSRVFMRCIATPGSRTHLCELTPSAYLYTLDLYPEFDEEVSDEVREHWYDQLIEAGHEDGHYMKYDSVWNKDGTPKFARWALQGVMTEEEAYEWARGNHLV